MRVTKAGRRRPTPVSLTDLWNRYFLLKSRHGIADARAQRARNLIAEHYIHQVRRKAETVVRRLPGNVDVDDLVSACSIRLLQAIERFDPARGLKFVTYLGSQLWGAICDELREADPLPRGARARLEAANDPRARPPVPLWIGDDPMHPEIDPVDYRNTDPGNRLETRDECAWWLESLTPKERRVLRAIYWDCKSQAEVADRLGLSAARISQVHNRIIHKLESLAFGKYWARYWKDHRIAGPVAP